MKKCFNLKNFPKLEYFPTKRIKCCKEIKITAPPNEWRNIPFNPVSSQAPLPPPPNTRVLLANFDDCFNSATVPFPVLEVCIPELIFLETRQDETGGHFLNWGYQDKSHKITVFWSLCSRKSGKNSVKIRDGTRLLSTTREILEWS